MTDSRLLIAQRGSGLSGSIIDSSTSLLARQTYDIVRFAMGAPAVEQIVKLQAHQGITTTPDRITITTDEGVPRLRRAVDIAGAAQ